MTRKERAEQILQSSGLWEALCRCGRPHLVGSCRMDLMAWNDVDIDIENEGMTTERLYALSAFIFQQFSPSWYEAKEEKNDAGQTVWFHGFEAMIAGELWNFDLWFFDKDTIAQAEAFCSEMTQKLKAAPELKAAILAVKERLIARQLYPHCPYTSMEIYDAVLHEKVRTAEEFLARRKEVSL